MKCTLFLCLLFSITSSAQVTISGRVLNDLTGEPLNGASVYINNSTLGATTNTEGAFTLSGIRPGNYELVVSFISFEVLVHTITVTDKDQKFEFRLSPKAKQMRNIFIMSSERRKEFLSLFREQFIGISLPAERTRILNEDDIMFEMGATADEIIAFADTTLVVVNRELGYKINFDLQEFYLNRKTGRTKFYGFSRYEELEANGKTKYAKRRLNIYLGSTAHFFHSMYDGKAEENGFQIYRMKVEKNMIMQMSTPSPSSEFIFRSKNGSQVYLDWDGRVMVRYNKNPTYKGYLSRKVILPGGEKKGVQSQLDMISRPAWLGENGALLTPLSIQYSGYWAHEKLADMLPVDYRPGN